MAHDETLGMLGTVLEAGQGGRDAIHIAVEPMVAAHKLVPGQLEGKDREGLCSKDADPLGVVDPFLTAPVKKGERFFMFLLPRSITGLRHVWSHPAFEEVPAITEADRELARKCAVRLEGVSIRWMKDYAERLNVTYDDLIDNTERYLADGSYWCDGGKFEGESLPDGFWDHYEKLTGKKVEEDKRESFFSCAC